MKLLHKTIAFVILFGFGVSFATIDAHSASRCDESTQISQVSPIQQHSAPTSDAGSTHDSTHCHCQGSANCLIDLFVPVSFESLEAVVVHTAQVFHRIQSVCLDGPSRPPQAA